MYDFRTLMDTLNTLFWQNPLAQTIGLFAFFIGASAFLHRDDQKLRYYLTAFTFLMALHFSLLGLWTTAIVALLGSARNYVSSLTDNIWVMSLFLLAVWLMAIQNSTDWVHLLAIVGVSLGTWAVFREQGIRMRICMSLGTVCWLSHNYIVGSIGGVVIEGLFLIVNTRTILKLAKEQITQKPA
ncbi:MAG: YgjV family protein [Paraglaciecola sp.]|uniref:YgjV family protein n=1 Tax=Paraglaciecola sp. TaxID=1920173 RepID=UPI003296BEF5